MTAYNKDWELSHQTAFLLNSMTGNRFQQETWLNSQMLGFHQWRYVWSQREYMQDFEDWHLSWQNREFWAWQGVLSKTGRRHCLKYWIQSNFFYFLVLRTFSVLSNGEVSPFLPLSWAGATSYFHCVSKETTLPIDVDVLQTLPILLTSNLYQPFFKSAEKFRTAIITQQDTAMFFSVVGFEKLHSIIQKWNNFIFTPNSFFLTFFSMWIVCLVFPWSDIET